MHPGLDPQQPEFEGIDELSLSVFRAFLRTLRLHRRLMLRTMAEHGAHPGQAICLRVLQHNDGITQRDLADELDVARPTVSRMLAGMERAGLVERATDAHDQRLARVLLTAKGRHLATELRAVAASHVNETIGRLPASDRADLARLLEELGDSLDEAIAAGAAVDGTDGGDVLP